MKNMIRGALLASCAMVPVALMPISAAYAQTANRVYSIAPQAMNDALRQFANQSGQDVVFDPALVAGLRSKGLQGSYDAEVALKAVVQGSKLEVYKTSSGFAIRGNASTASTTSDGGVTASSEIGVIQGRVVDQGSGRALRGALIEIVELGLTTSTDEAGKFSFPSVADGNYRVRASYLGYREEGVDVSLARSGANLDLRLGGGSSEGEIVVYGQRSARATALNQERTAENVTTVVSSDELGDFQGTTLSESLRKVSGVAFQRDPNTGDGTNIIIRGLAPDFNTVKVNGVELPEGSGRGRSASLSNILTESVGNVKISKTLLPNQDSTGTGGLVEIETKTPFDRPRRFASFTIEGAKRAKGFNNEFLAAGTISATFGSEDQFGLSASVQYRDRTIKRVSYDADLAFPFYLPLCEDGSPCISDSVFVDPRLDFPFESEAGADVTYPRSLAIFRGKTATKNLGVTLSAAVKPFEGTQLFLDYQRYDEKDSGYELYQTFNPLIFYSEQPVGALGGELRQSLRWFRNRFDAYDSGNYTPENKSITNIFTFRGETKRGPISFEYSAGYTRGQQTAHRFGIQISRQGNRIAPELLLPEATDPVEGRVVTPFGPRAPGDDSLPFPLFNDAGFDYLNDATQYSFGQATENFDFGRNSRLTGNWNTRYDFSSKILRYIEAGISYERSEFQGGNGSKGGINYSANGLASPADLGLYFDQSSLGSIGVSRGINYVSPRSLIDFFVNQLPLVPTQAELTPGDLIYKTEDPIDPRLSKAFTREAEIVGFIQGRVELGKLEVIGGARISRVKINSRNLTGPRIIRSDGTVDTDFFTANSGLVDEQVTQMDILPRIVANYRFSDRLVVRAGYYLSVARPQINLMSTDVVANLDLRPFFGPTGTLPQLSVRKGNPDLSPSSTNSFDVSLEHYSRSIGVMKLGAFYKRINNFLENNVSAGSGALDDVAQVIPDDPRFQDVLANPNNYWIEVSIASNNSKPAHIWGLEASLERRFNFLPGAFGGLGIFANYTFTKSSKTQPGRWDFSPILDGSGAVVGYETLNFNIPHVPFTGSAPHSGTFAVTYNKNGVDASLGYTWQSRRIGSYQPWHMSKYEEGYGTLDARLEYQFKRLGGEFRIFVEGADLLRGTEDPGIRSTIGADDGYTGKYFTGARYFGGRQFRLGVSTKF